MGDWILVYFPQEERGRKKLSRPWHGPYRVLSKRDPNLTCAKVYFPHHGELHVHQSRTCPCPLGFPAGYYWHGTKRKGPGRPTRWVDVLLADGPRVPDNGGQTDTHGDRSVEDTAQPVDRSPNVPTPPHDDSVSSEGQLPPMEATSPVDTPLESTDAVYSPMECADADNTPWDDPALRSDEVDHTYPTIDERSAPMPRSSLLNQPPFQHQDTDEAARRGGPSSIPQTGSRPQTGPPGPHQRDRRLRQVVRPPDRFADSSSRANFGRGGGGVADS